MAALMDYLNAHGHCNVPPGAVYECILTGMGDDNTDLHYKGDLGNWLHQEKMRLRTRKSPKIAEERKFFEQLAAEGNISNYYYLTLCT